MPASPQSIESFVSVIAAAALGAILACGDAPARPVSPSAPGAASPAATAATAGPGTGPTTTTTQTLDDGGAGGGTKLVPGGRADAVPSHKSEPGRSIEDITAIVASHRDEARACYDSALPGHPGIEGNIDIRWTIDPAGVVSDADVDSSRSDILEPAVGNCIIAILKKIHFNASAKRFETKAHYPFNFHPHSRKSAPDAGR